MALRDFCCACLITPLILILILLLIGGRYLSDRYPLPVLFHIPVVAFLMLPEDVCTRLVGYRAGCWRR